MPERGEVWQVDFGITQKVRPALVISIPFGDADRALIGVIPHTTAVRGSQFEVHIAAPFLSEGAFLVQGIQALPPKYFLRGSQFEVHIAAPFLSEGAFLSRAFKRSHRSISCDALAFSHPSSFGKWSEPCCIGRDSKQMNETANQPLQATAAPPRN